MEVFNLFLFPDALSVLGYLRVPAAAATNTTSHFSQTEWHKLLALTRGELQWK